MRYTHKNNNAVESRLASQTQPTAVCNCLGAHLGLALVKLAPRVALRARRRRLLLVQRQLAKKIERRKNKKLRVALCYS
jgi:macrodomain Ter protein organizer (MatP/YcbG family)